MKKKLNLELEKEEETLTNIVPINRSLIGMDGGILPPGTDWLSPLPEGTEFLCKMLDIPGAQPPGSPQIPRFVLQIGTVLKHLEKARWIRLSDGKAQVQEFFVDPKAFCKVFEKYAIINDEDRDKLPINESTFQGDRTN